MSYIDIAIIAIVVLCALIGLWKGFFKTVISFFGLLVSFMAAFFLTKPVVGALLDIDAVKNFVVGGGSGFSLFGWISGKLSDITSEGVLGTLLSPFIKLSESQGVDVHTGVSLLLANGIFSIMVCIGLFIVIRFILLLFTMFANAMSKGKFVGALNRLLGLIFGAVKGAWHVCVLMFILSFLLGFSFMAPVRNQIDNSVIAAPVYEQVTKLSEKFITGGEDTLIKLLDLHDKANKPDKQPEAKPEHGVYKYASSGDEDSVFEIELMAGGKFEQRSEGTILKGTYEIADGVLTLNFEGLQPSTATIDVENGYIKLNGLYLVKDGYTIPMPEPMPEE